MKPNAVLPTIEGPYYAYPCQCTHRTCKNWHVANVADMQSVSFTREQAILVADVLNVVEGAAAGTMHPNFHPHMPSLDAAIEARKNKL